MFHAGGWVAASFIVGQLMRFGSNLLLTRLLVPEMFGIMTVVAVILVGFSMFSDVGLLQNIVQSSRGGEQRFLNTAWVMQIARGALLFVLVLLSSWLLVIAGGAGWLPEGSVYADPLLPMLLSVMSVDMLISGFASTKLLTATRNMMLARVSLLQLGCQFIGIIAMIALAWMYSTIWALVIGSLIGSFSKMMLSHIFLPGSGNRFQWDFAAFYEIFHFGKWIFLSTVLGFFVNQGDRLLLGGLISPAMLGVYSIAYFLANAMALLLLRVSGMVFFPALSKVARDRPEELANVYYRIRWRVDGVVFFVAGFFWITGRTIIEFLYDSRYSEAGWMLETLSISLMGAGFLVAGQCFLALGKARLLMILNAVQVVILYSLLPLMFLLYGIEGAIYVTALAPIARGFAAWWFMRKLELLRMRRELVMVPMILVGLTFGTFFNYICS